MDFEVIDGRAVGFWWQPGLTRGCQRRWQAPRTVVLHHQGGEGGQERLYRTLHGSRTNRRTDKPIYLSVHFGIDVSGSVTQYSDIQTYCYHAGKANRHSVGIEIANVGKGDDSRRYPRTAYSDEVHGVFSDDYLRFYPAQVKSAASLCHALCELLGIPFQFPMDGKRVRRTVLSDQELKAHKGLLGHLHVSERKVDPSPHLLDDLAAMASLPPSHDAPSA